MNLLTLELQSDDTDVSMLLQLLIPEIPEKKKKQHKTPRKTQQTPIFFAEPMRASNSFVGTEEYIAPVCVHLVPLIPFK